MGRLDVFRCEEAFHHLQRGEVRAVVRRHRDRLVLQHLGLVDVGVARDGDGEHRHRSAERDDLAPAKSLAIGLDGALHDAPFAHAELVDAAVIVDGLERALEDGIELDEVGRRDLRHPRRRHEVDVQALVPEEPLVAGDEHGKVMDRVHDRDLGLLRGLHNIHDASSRIRCRLPRMIDLVRSAVNGAIRFGPSTERSNGTIGPQTIRPQRCRDAGSAARNRTPRDRTPPSRRRDNGVASKAVPAAGYAKSHGNA